jgi:hypothetical protein
MRLEHQAPCAGVAGAGADTRARWGADPARTLGCAPYSALFKHIEMTSTPAVVLGINRVGELPRASCRAGAARADVVCGSRAAVQDVACIYRVECVVVPWHCAALRRRFCVPRCMTPQLLLSLLLLSLAFAVRVVWLTVVAAGRRADLESAAGPAPRRAERRAESREEEGRP